MKRGLQRFLFLTTLALALVGGYHLGLRQHDHNNEATTEFATEAHKTQYTCSMHPFIIRDEPGGEKR